MSEQINENKLTNETQEAEVAENIQPAEIPAENPVEAEAPVADKPKMSKKKLAIIAAAAIAVIAIALIIFIPSKFERVKSECVQIAGIVTGSGDYFILDTLPDTYENMDETVKALLLPGAQENALEAIRYANEELGFNGSVYSQMMNTTALMGRQSAENDKYRVSWTYHPNDGLEVTYEKK